MIRLTLYTRPGCHLCEALKDVVDAVAREQPIALREVDISGDVALKRRFGTEIPVLAPAEKGWSPASGPVAGCYGAWRTRNVVRTPRAHDAHTHPPPGGRRRQLTAT